MLSKTTLLVGFSSPKQHANPAQIFEIYLQCMQYQRSLRFFISYIYISRVSVQYSSTKIWKLLIHYAKIMNIIWYKYLKHTFCIVHLFLLFFLIKFWSCWKGIEEGGGRGRDWRVSLNWSLKKFRHLKTYLKTVLCAKIQILESVILMHGGGIL